MPVSGTCGAGRARPASFGDQYELSSGPLLQYAAVGCGSLTQRQRVADDRDQGAFAQACRHPSEGVGRFRRVAFHSARPRIVASFTMASLGVKLRLPRLPTITTRPAVARTVRSFSRFRCAAISTITEGP
ncbi:hypothetical protein UK15_37010 [Streptomyces variegatus]|uniref:Uncharacterized protein n=1 Tax=Streptomyces variegatus TaxID=284040 RepID=A0A0M2GH47_9ACTN|nr:hypothetical protein UK15_37010 [Streptomyces variegatus]